MTKRGHHIAGINCNVYLCKQDIHDLGRVLACLERFTKYGCTFCDWLADGITCELFRVGTHKEPDPLILPLTWDDIDYSNAAVVLMLHHAGGRPSALAAASFVCRLSRPSPHARAICRP